MLFWGAPLLTLCGLETLLNSSCNAINDEFHFDTVKYSVDCKVTFSYKIFAAVRLHLCDGCFVLAVGPCRLRQALEKRVVLEAQLSSSHH